MGVTISICTINECQPNYSWDQMYIEVMQQCLEPADMLRFLSLSNAFPLKRDRLTTVNRVGANGIPISLAIEDDHKTRFRYGQCGF
jgi:hypothetical protein